MAGLERQIRTSQHRLWTNRWLHRTAWAMTAAGGLFATTVLVARFLGIEEFGRFALAWLATTCERIAET